MDQIAMNDISSEQTQGAPSKTMKVDVSAVLGDKTKTGGETLSSCIDIENLNLFYSKDKQALIDINLTIPKQRVTAFIGPSGCGKSSLLRCFNRMNDLVDDCVIEGLVSLDGS
ncbi:MAG: ATP-binding cassette domain-containing protein, partial [Gammaproteobacteria bacterium]